MIYFFNRSFTIGLLFSALMSWSAPLMAAQGPPAPMNMTSTEQPRELRDIGIDEKLNDNLDLNLKFKNEKGEDVTLGSFYDGTHPVIISLVYYACPGLCSFHLNGVVDSLKKLDWSAGQQYQYVVISFDPKDTAELAIKKKENYLKSYDRAGTENGWHFLTADAATAEQITKQIGFRYKWVEETQEWAHASAAVVTTPQGKISRYLHGIMFDERTFKLALNEATEGKIGSFVDRMVWYCFHYDPHQSKYTLYATNVMKLGGGVMILVMAAFLVPAWMGSRREQT